MPSQGFLLAPLLGNLNSVFDEEKLRTTDLLEKLNAMDEAPWSAYTYGRPLTGRGLADLLKPYHIKSKTIRFGTKTDKGYYRSDFEDAWEVYLEIHPKTSVTTVTDVTIVTPDTGITSSLREFEGILMS